MAIFGTWQRAIFIIIAALSALTITSCEKTRVQIEPSDLDYQNPFGLDWRSFDRQGDQIGAGHWAECRELIAQLGIMITPDNTDYFVSKCAQKKYTTIFIPSDRLSPSFRKGKLSVVVRGEAEPVLYNYSFLHRILPDDDLKNKRERRKHAAAIRKELIQIYGPPLATGHYNQVSSAGFVVDDDKQQPCAFWLNKNTGILLCSERIVLIDGIEMALSFIRLDRVPFGPSLRCMVNPLSIDDCEDASENASSKTTSDDVSFLETLADWLGADALNNCKSDGLEPIESMWSLSETEQEIIADILETLSGEDLALYAIKNSGELGSDLSPRTQEKLLLFLLKIAASQGSAIAMNEIGVSLLYCLQNVQQDIPLAQYWLEKAATAGDSYAMISLAFMHLNGMIDASNSIEEATQLLEQCSMTDPEYCLEKLTALNAFLASMPPSDEAK